MENDAKQLSILLAEDNEEIRKFVALGLKLLGYRVFTVINGLDAFQIIKKDPDEFEVMITDYQMPRMNGIQLIMELKKFHIDIPVILCSASSKLSN